VGSGLACAAILLVLLGLTLGAFLGFVGGVFIEPVMSAATAATEGLARVLFGFALGALLGFVGGVLVGVEGPG
jgi:hypothetical protein